MSQTRNLPPPADQRTGESLAAPAAAGQGDGIGLLDEMRAFEGRFWMAVWLFAFAFYLVFVAVVCFA